MGISCGCCVDSLAEKRGNDDDSCCRVVGVIWIVDVIVGGRDVNARHDGRSSSRVRLNAVHDGK